MGLHIDGPYKKDEIINNINDEQFYQHFLEVDIPDDVQLFFIDSQGFGDQRLKNFPQYESMLERIISIFSAISDICISLVTINADDSINRLFKTIRRIQLNNYNDFKQILLLVKGYDKFDSIDDSTYESLNEFHHAFPQQYLDEHPNISKYYLSHCLNILSLGNPKINTESYFHSVWYAFSQSFSKLKKEVFRSKADILENLTFLSKTFFGKGYLNIIGEITNFQNRSLIDLDNYFPQYQENVKNIIKCCLSCFLYLANTIESIIHSSKNCDINQIDGLIQLIQTLLTMISSHILPYLLGEFDISVAVFIQYIYIIQKNIRSIIKSNSDKWRKVMDYFISPFRVLSNPNNSFKDICKAALHLYMYPPLLILGFLETKTLMNAGFKTMIYPFIWEYNLIKNKCTNFNMTNIKKIDEKNEQLIIYYEQNGNDSFILFRSLTGMNTVCNNEEKVSLLFPKVSVNSLIERFKYQQKQINSKFENAKIKKANVLYIKGYSNEEFQKLVEIQSAKTIFVSSITKDQELTIHPNNRNLSYVFYLSEELYAQNTVNKKMYVEMFKNQHYNEIAHKLNIKNGFLLPISSNDYNLTEAMPIVGLLIRYGCRMILQDASFEPLINNVNS